MERALPIKSAFISSSHLFNTKPGASAIFISGIFLSSRSAVSIIRLVLNVHSILERRTR